MSQWHEESSVLVMILLFQFIRLNFPLTTEEGTLNLRGLLDRSCPNQQTEPVSET
jgi:hypothetical protein